MQSPFLLFFASNAAKCLVARSVGAKKLSLKCSAEETDALTETLRGSEGSRRRNGDAMRDLLTACSISWSKAGVGRYFRSGKDGEASYPRDAEGKASFIGFGLSPSDATALLH